MKKKLSAPPPPTFKHLALKKNPRLPLTHQPTCMHLALKTLIAAPPPQHIDFLVQEQMCTGRESIDLSICWFTFSMSESFFELFQVSRLREPFLERVLVGNTTRTRFKWVLVAIIQ